MTSAARTAARDSGLLPHEILLDMARGNPQVLKVVKSDGEVEEKQVSVSMEQRMDAAKAASPYYAPKISTVELITGVNDDDLDAIIARAAAEAGISLDLGGEGTEAGAEEDEDETPARATPRRGRVALD